ncbi:MAG TPA: protoglobin domain-containing protein [Candidatus Polarisedimenticolia bacterium]|nr:protoglobin domain-containing protein [Candidatus Polarisedimenticolia bacterium]
MESMFEEMKRYVGFTQDDAENLAGFRPLASPFFPRIADEFYARIREHPRAHQVFSGPEQVERLKLTLQLWADRLLAGPHDEEYFRLRCRIGRMHVQIGLQQMYMFTAMHQIREAFRRIAFQRIPDDEAKSRVIGSLHKILDLELAIMLETYREDYVERLWRSESQASLKRLAAIGEVAASVAHEVRNPLAGISGAVEVLRDDLPPDSPRREVIREVLWQIRRLDERVRDLLIYSRSVALRPAPSRPAELIASTLSLLAEEPLMKGIRVKVSVQEGIGDHLLDRGLIIESLVNLIRNASDAMGGKGELKIEARRRDGVLVLALEDAGPGVPAGRREEIFAPFFTTRPQGTGLGLANARKAAEAHGGTLICEEGTAGGARFVMTLPASPGARETGESWPSAS